MSTDAPQSDEPVGRPAEWLRPVALGLACIVIGFVVGWIVRGDGGEASALAPAGPGVGTITGDGGGGGATTTASAPEPAPPPPRGEVGLVVLNGTEVTGAAADTAAEAEALGYQDVQADNAPTTSDPTTVYFRTGSRPAAERAGTDLGLSAVTPLPKRGPLADAAPESADVVVVLGSG